jgi:hypothetical protein
MKKENLPTFRKWGKKLFERRRVIVIALLIFGGHRIARNYLKEYYAVILPCDQPCQDAVSCDPLEFTFEVTPAKIKLGQPYSLWYRARIKNRSCRQLAGISARGFLDSKELGESPSNLWVTISGPDGRKIERLPVPGPDGGISWDYGSAKGVAISTKGTIYPYQPNYERIKNLFDSGRIKEPGYVNLEPGETFETITSVLRPYRIVAWSFRTEDGGMGDGYRRVQVENPPTFQTPHEGFNFLDRYVFAHPGRYTIRAGFAQKISVYPIFARWENRSHWLDFIFWDTYPEKKWDSQDREVNLLAPQVTIEAAR